jgi:hypothetical protein
LGLKGRGGRDVDTTQRKWDFFDHVRSKESMVDIAPTTSTTIVQQQRRAME